jgi:hypothetical protein
MGRPLVVYFQWPFICLICQTPDQGIWHRTKRLSNLQAFWLSFAVRQPTACPIKSMAAFYEQKQLAGIY